MDGRPIGFLDSGVGGLSLWSAATALLPDESTVLIADGRCFPYGDMPAQEVRTRATHLAHALLERDVKLVVVACNTASVHALAHLRMTFPSVPFVGVVPVIKTLAQQTRTGTIAVLSTPSTAESAYLEALVREFAPDKRLINIACPGLAELVEAGSVDSPEVDAILELYLAEVRGAGADVLGLACTHYVFLQDPIRRLLGEEVRVYEPSLPVARRILAVLQERAALAPAGAPRHELLSTGDVDAFASAVSRLLSETRTAGAPYGAIRFGSA